MGPVLSLSGSTASLTAGSAAGIDLMLHLVRSDFGVEAANRVARRLVMPAHRSGGQAQFIERPVPADREHRHAQPIAKRVREDLLPLLQRASEKHLVLITETEQLPDGLEGDATRAEPLRRLLDARDYERILLVGYVFNWVL